MFEEFVMVQSVQPRETICLQASIPLLSIWAMEEVVLLISCREYDFLMLHLVLFVCNLSELH